MNRAANAVSLLLLTTCVAQEEHRSPGVEWSMETARIVFTGHRGGKSDLYVLDRATGAISRITSDSAASWGASPSPDGSRIAFLSRRDGNYEIYVMPAAGGDAVNLTNHPDYDLLAAWSPSADRIAFMSTRGFELGDPGPFPGHIYVMNVDGSELRQLTKEPLASSLGPGDWSPDGRHLLLSREVDGQLDVFLLDVETGEERRITSAPENEYSADFSNDGARIAYHAESESESQIVIQDLDGSSRRILTSGPGLRYTPHWSPDDRWLIYTAEGSPAGQYDLKAIRIADGLIVDIVVTEEDERDGVFLR